MTVLLIAALHAVPVVLAAHILRSRRALYVAAVAMALFAVFTGSPRFWFVDFLAVGGALIYGLGVITSAASSTALTPEEKSAGGRSS